MLNDKGVDNFNLQSNTTHAEVAAMFMSFLETAE